MTDQQISESPGTGQLSFAITPSDSVNYPYGAARAIYVGSAGDVVLVNWDGSTTLWANCPAGLVIPSWSCRVNNTNTTASNLVGIT